MRFALRTMLAAPSVPPVPAQSAFREVERRFKVRVHPDDFHRKATPSRPHRGYRPSLDDVYDPRTARALSLPAELLQVGGEWGQAKREMSVFPVGPGGWAVRDVPGLVILPNYFSPDQQRALVRSCLGTHTVPPNATNRDTHFALPPAGLWSTACTDPTQVVQTKASLLASTILSEDEQARRAERFAKEGTGRVLVENAPGEGLGSVEELKKRVLLEVEPSKGLKNKQAVALVRDLRWTNLGLFYDWTSKSYDFNKPIPFPRDISTIAKKVVRDIDWKQVYADVTPPPEGQPPIGWETWDDYEPDAGIINFYSPEDTLMAHVDRSELDPHRPLVSISLGLSAVFLLGGTTRDTPPLPILLRSGDAIVMSGPGRRSYHGVPRVLDSTLPGHLEAGAEDDWDDFAAYLKTTRININARQVFPGGWDQGTEQGGRNSAGPSE